MERSKMGTKNWLRFQDTSLSSIEIREQVLLYKTFLFEHFGLIPIISYKTHISETK